LSWCSSPPSRGTRYPARPTADPADYIERCCEKVYQHFEEPATLYHRNVRKILDACFPGLGFAEQMRRAWITDAYLCSAPVEGGNVPGADHRG